MRTRALLFAVLLWTVGAAAQEEADYDARAKFCKQLLMSNLVRQASGAQHWEYFAGVAVSTWTCCFEQLKDVTRLADEIRTERQLEEFLDALAKTRDPDAALCLEYGCLVVLRQWWVEGGMERAPADREAVLKARATLCAWLEITPGEPVNDPPMPPRLAEAHKKRVEALNAQRAKYDEDRKTADARAKAEREAWQEGRKTEEAKAERDTRPEDRKATKEAKTGRDTRPEDRKTTKEARPERETRDSVPSEDRRRNRIASKMGELEGLKKQRKPEAPDVAVLEAKVRSLTDDLEAARAQLREASSDRSEAGRQQRAQLQEQVSQTGEKLGKAKGELVRAKDEATKATRLEARIAALEKEIRELGGSVTEPAKAETTPAAQADTPKPKKTLVLKDGTEIPAAMVTETTDGYTIKDLDGKTRTIPKAQVEQVRE